MTITDEKRPLFEVVDVENIKEDANSKKSESDNDTKTYIDRKHQLERLMEKGLYNSRWILSLMYLCLIVVLAIILIRFVSELAVFVVNVWGLTDNQWIIQVLELLDLTLVANLVLIVAFSGYENFVSKIDDAEEGHDKLPWMGKLDFSGLKLKIIGSIVAISLIELLQDFLNATSHVDPNFEFWRIVLHLVFVVTGVAFAAMEVLAGKKEEIEEKSEFSKKERKLL